MENTCTILIANDNAKSLNDTALLLAEIGYNSICADSVDSVFSSLEDTTLHGFSRRAHASLLILLDIDAVNCGYTLIKSLKQHKNYRSIPIIFMADRKNSDAVARGYDVGATDFVSKPLDRTELSTRIKACLTLRFYDFYIETLASLERELFEANKSVAEHKAELKKLAAEMDFAIKTDFLTGLHNRKYMIGEIEKVFDGKEPEGTFAVILADLDKFKSINDFYGHDCGDEVLKRVSAIFRRVIRPVDAVARWGGEEFIFLIGGMTKETAKGFAERIRKELESVQMQYNGETFTVTVTLGVAMINADDTISDVIKRADGALYMGKNNGRNRVEFMDHNDFTFH